MSDEMQRRGTGRLSRIASTSTLACLLVLFTACGGASNSNVTSTPAPKKSVPSTAIPDYSSNYTPLHCIVTAEEYANVKMGMKYDEVVKVIGAEHTKFVDFQTEKRYVWENQGVLAGGSFAEFTFQNDVVVYLSQSGLPKVPGSEKLEPGEIEKSDPSNAPGEADSTTDK